MSAENVRRSLVGLGAPGTVLAPVPDGALTTNDAGESDLRHLLGLYRRFSGSSGGGPTPSVDPFDTDIDAMLLDFGVPVQYGAFTTTKGGLLDTEDEPQVQEAYSDEAVVERLTVLLTKTGKIPDLAPETPITVNSVPYWIQNTRLLDDGKLVLLVLRRL